MPSISKCQHFPSPRASTKTYRNQNPVSKSILFPKKLQAHLGCLVRFHPKKNSPSNSKALGIFQKTPKLPANHALHLSHVERFPVGRPKPRRYTPVKIRSTLARWRQGRQGSSRLSSWNGPLLWDIGSFWGVYIYIYTYTMTYSVM